MIKEITSIMSKKDKIHVVLIFFVILGSAFLDLIGIATILPIVSLLTVAPEDAMFTITGNFILKTVATIFNEWNPDKLVIIVLCLFCILFTIKAAYGFMHTYVLNRFSLNYSRRLTRRLMEAYLYFPYEFHLNNNSSILIRKCTYDVDMFTGTVSDLLNFLTKTITAAAILVFLMLTDWRIALIAGGVVLVFAILLVFVLKPKSKKLSIEIQDLNSYNYKFLSQAFKGIKESKISNKEKYFVDEYDDNRIQITKKLIERNLLNAVPTHCIELVGMFGIAASLLVILLITKDTTKAELVSKFAVFAYAVIKLLPAITTMTSVLNNLNFYKVSVDSLSEDLETSSRISKEMFEEVVKPLCFNDVINVNKVTFYYESSPDKIILDNVSLKIKKNTSVAFCGQSGAGKTTLIDIILGLLPCRSGAVLCDDENIESNMRGWRTNISYIPQTIYLTDDTIRKNIAFGINSDDIDDDRVWDALDKAQLKDFVERLPKKLDTIIGEGGIRMSGGQRQRIGIARAFYRNTNIIVFDEATSALDYETEKNILDHVSKFSKNHTLIIITHRLNTIESCDEIYKINQGLIEKVK